MFYGCTALVNVQMHDDITKIGNYAFDQCSSIKNIELENSYCDFKPFKLDENRILIIEKVSEDNSYDYLDGFANIEHIYVTKQQNI